MTRFNKHPRFWTALHPLFVNLIQSVRLWNKRFTIVTRVNFIIEPFPHIYFLDIHQNFCKTKVLQGVFISRHVTTSHVTYSSYPLWKKWWKGLIRSTQQNWHGVISSFVLVEWLTLDASCSLRVRIPRWKSLASRVSERERAIVSIELCGSCLPGCIALLPPSWEGCPVRLTLPLHPDNVIPTQKPKSAGVETQTMRGP